MLKNIIFLKQIDGIRIMKDKKLLKLPSKNYRDSLKNFMKIRINKNFEKYNNF